MEGFQTVSSACEYRQVCPVKVMYLGNRLMAFSITSHDVISHPSRLSILSVSHGNFDSVSVGVSARAVLPVRCSSSSLSNL
jgi:hypothetical protein